MSQQNPTARDEQLLSAYIDGELTADESREVKVWLAEDAEARGLVEELRSVAATLQGLPAQVLSEDWKRSLAKRLDRATISSSSATPSSAGTKEVVPRLSVGRSMRGWMWSAGAIAAALMVMFLLPDPEKNIEIAKAPGEVASATGEAEDDGEFLDAAHLVDGTRKPEPESNVIDASNDRIVPRSAPLAEAAPPALAAGEKTDLAMDSAAPAADDENRFSGVASAPRGAMRSQSMEAPLASLDREDRAALEDGPYLIVWADMPAESLRRQEFHALLRDNLIEVEQETDTWTNVAEPVRRQIASRNLAQADASLGQTRIAPGLGGGGFGGGRSGLPAESNEKEEQNSELAAKSSGRGRFSVPERKPPAIEGETLLVEASVEQIAACLLDMNGDTGNFRTITIEPVDGRQLLSDDLARREKLATKEQLAASIEDKQKRRRELEQADKVGTNDEGVPEELAAESRALALDGVEKNGARSRFFQGRAQRVDRPGDWYLLNRPPKENGDAYLLRNKSGELSRKNIKSVRGLGELEQQVASLHQLYSKKMLQKGQALNRAKSIEGRKAAPPLQVLFVLRNVELGKPIAEASDASSAEPEKSVKE